MHIAQELFYRCVGILPCLHNFCAPCYGAWRKRGKQVLSAFIPTERYFFLSSTQCPICRQRVKGVQINHSMRNMVAAFLKQYPERNRDPASLLDLDAAGDLTEEMLKEGKTKQSRGKRLITCLMTSFMMLSAVSCARLLTCVV